MTKQNVSHTPRILVIGCNGQVGWELSRSLLHLGNVLAVGRKELDLTDESAIQETLRRLKPQHIVNAAAYTMVDEAESEVGLAMKINGEAPGVIARTAAELGSVLIHYSTDYVFDGSSTTPYYEHDATNPLNVYGQSKLIGEQAIIDAGCDHMILRTSWVYGLRGKNFLNTIIRKASEKVLLNVVDDQYGSPTWSRSIAEVTAQIIAQDKLAGYKGICHLTSSGETTWHDFAEYIVEKCSEFIDLKCRVVKPLSSESYGVIAQRPKRSVLSLEKLNAEWNIHMPDWRETLNMCLADLRNAILICKQYTMNR